MKKKELEYLKKYGNPDTYFEDKKRVEDGEPVQYVVGNVDFYGNCIEVNPSVLIPRFETEELIYQVVQFHHTQERTPKRILDLGTGSGCIAITLKKIFPDSEVIAVDISKEALEVARKNAEQNKVEITFLEGNFLDPVEGTFDLVVSNPPYIATSEAIDEIVDKYEPHLALYADHDGLSCYEEILSKLKKHVTDQSVIAFEIGYLQGPPIKLIAQHYFDGVKIEVKKDLQGKDRYVLINM